MYQNEFFEFFFPLKTLVRNERAKYKFRRLLRGERLFIVEKKWRSEKLGAKINIIQGQGDSIRELSGVCSTGVFYLPCCLH